MDQAVTAIPVEYAARAREEHELMREVVAGIGALRLDDPLPQGGSGQDGICPYPRGAGGACRGGDRVRRFRADP